MEVIFKLNSLDREMYICLLLVHCIANHFCLRKYLLRHDFAHVQHLVYFIKISKIPISQNFKAKVIMIKYRYFLTRITLSKYPDILEVFHLLGQRL